MKHFTESKRLVLFLSLVVISTFTFAQKYTGLTAIPSDGTSQTSYMFDNDMGTRWQDASNLDDASFVVDLGEVKNVNSIKIYWEGANAKDYTLSFSTDDLSFTGDLNYTNMAAGARTDLINGLNIDCRYIKFQGVTRQLPYGYSIWEFEVYPAVTPVLTSLSLTPASSGILLGQTQQLTVGGLDQLGNLFTLTNPTVWTVDGTGASVDANGSFSSTAKGLFTVTATNSEISKTATVDVLPTNDNLSIAATATASTGTPAAAIDNNNGTRWESAAEDPQWILVDLGALKNITDMLISWETANAKDYTIEYSSNSTDWTTLVTKTDMPAGSRTDRLYDLNFNARYIRLNGTARTTIYGYSIWEFKIFGSANVSTLNDPLSPKNNINVYPNPATDMIKITGEISEVAIYSLQGQLVLTSFNRNSVDVSALSRGMYLVRLTDKAGNKVASKLEIR